MSEYHPVLITTDDEFTPYVEWSARRFEQLNGVRPQVITSKDVKDINYPGEEWLAAWIWDLVPSSVDRVLYMSKVVMPILPIAPDSVPAAGFASIKAIDHYNNYMMKKYPILEKAGVTHDATMFFVHRNLQSTFDSLKQFSRRMPFDVALNLALRTFRDKQQLPRNWNWYLWGCPATDYTRVKFICVKADNRAVVLSLMASIKMVLSPC